MEKVIKKFGMTEKQLKEFCKDKTIDELHEIFGGNLNTLKSNLNYHCVNFKRAHRKLKKVPNRNLMILTLVRNNFTYAEIGTVFNISRQRVEQIVNGD